MRENMPKPRCQQVSLIDTPFYHCISRCVRRAFLCGADNHTGKSYEHRRGWVEDRLLTLAKVFAIDVCAYSVMHNHVHTVLHVDENTAKSWSIEEVLHKWHQLFNGTVFTQQYVNGVKLSKTIMKLVIKSSEEYRQRLMDISWFMRALNEPIARQANEEDNCTGRFWEGRFKSQPLLDEAALAACMAYVDLNPIRSNIAKTPETSAHTSIMLRSTYAKQGEQPSVLAPFIGNPKKGMPKGLPFPIEDYLQLVDLTGRCIRHDKSGFIDNANSNILTRLNISPENWLILTTKFESHFKNVVGSPASIKKYRQNQKLKRLQDICSSEIFLNTG